MGRGNPDKIIQKTIRQVTQQKGWIASLIPSPWDGARNDGLKRLSNKKGNESITTPCP